MNLTITHASEEHISAIYALVRELAEFEKLSHVMVATENDLQNALFGVEPVARALLAFADGVPTGLALYFYNFSTFLGKRGIYLEDLFVQPQYRGRGIGLALLRHLAAIAKEQGCGRIEWSVLTWNQPSIDFYRRLGAVALEDWQIFRLSGDALQKLAEPE